MQNHLKLTDLNFHYVELCACIANAVFPFYMEDEYIDYKHYLCFGK